jgi:hypothetical protein
VWGKHFAASPPAAWVLALAADRSPASAVFELRSGLRQQLSPRLAVSVN